MLVKIYPYIASNSNILQNSNGKMIDFFVKKFLMRNWKINDALKGTITSKVAQFYFFISLNFSACSIFSFSTIPSAFFFARCSFIAARLLLRAFASAT